MPKTTLLTAIAVGALVALAVAFNPSPDKHRAEMRKVLSERSPVAGALGIGSLTALASNYHSLGVASYTKVGDSTITVGAFGNVIVLQ